MSESISGQGGQIMSKYSELMTISFAGLYSHCSQYLTIRVLSQYRSFFKISYFLDIEKR